MIQCPHCGSHDVTECPEYAIDDCGLETGKPQLHAFCLDCGNEFDPDDPAPPRIHAIACPLEYYYADSAFA